MFHLPLWQHANTVLSKHKSISTVHFISLCFSAPSGPSLLITTHFLNFAVIATSHHHHHHHQGNLQGNKWSLLKRRQFNLLMFQVTYMESTSFYWTDGWQRSVRWIWTNFYWSCTRVHLHTHKFVMVEWGWELRTKLTNFTHYIMTYSFSTTTILKPVPSYSGMCNIQFKSQTMVTDWNASELCFAPFQKEKHLSGSSPILVPIYFIRNRKQSEVIKALLWFYSSKA